MALVILQPSQRNIVHIFLTALIVTAVLGSNSTRLMRESLPNKCVFNIAEITQSRNRLHCMTSCLNLHISCISVTFDGVNCEMSEYTDLTTCSADRVGIRSYYLANITTDMVNNLDESGFSASTTAVVPQSTVIRRLAPSHSLNLVQEGRITDYSTQYPSAERSHYHISNIHDGVFDDVSLEHGYCSISTLEPYIVIDIAAEYMIEELTVLLWYKIERYLTDIEVSISDTTSALNFPSSVCSSRSGEAILSPDAHVCTLSAVTPVRYVKVQSKAEISVNLCITEIQVFSTISNNTLTTWGRSSTTAPPN